MAFDGLVVSNIVSELNKKLVGGRIVKISQPEKDELILTIKNYDNYKLFISANASLPLVYLTNVTKQNPKIAPAFCMLLRKHFNSARILEIIQPDFERIIRIKIEHLNEMGDLCIKYLIVELMGKHSNIILCDEEDVIIDSIKRINSAISSVREVLPGRKYFVPNQSDKLNPLLISSESFENKVISVSENANKAIYSTFTGISPLIANEMCHRAQVDSDLPISVVDSDKVKELGNNFSNIFSDIAKENYFPNIITKDGKPVEFSSIKLTTYTDYPDFVSTEFDSISELLEKYYNEKNVISRIKQKSTDLRRIVGNAFDRANKKYQLQLKQLSDTESRDKYRIYGELINTYGYGLEEGVKVLSAFNYYDNNEIDIPLDPMLSAKDNAKKYFDKYGKLKRTYEALTKYIEETKEELIHLDSIKTALDLALFEEDLQELKNELTDYGYIKKHNQGKKQQRVTSKPHHYVIDNKYHIYVGKNNYQNDDLTFRFATGNDWWFHAKKVPGSHCVLKTISDGEIPDDVFVKAAQVAGYYSKNRDNDRVEIDYLQKKNVKKPSGAKPGFVVYYTNYSMVVKPSLEGVDIGE